MLMDSKTTLHLRFGWCGLSEPGLKGLKRFKDGGMCCLNPD